MKFQPRNWNSFITASVFQINETNVLVPNSSFTDYQTGEVRSRGVELSGWQLWRPLCGRNAADSANSFFVPIYALLDGSLRFGYRHTFFSVNATILTDKRYVATCIGLSSCYYGYARNVIGTAQYRF